MNSIIFYDGNCGLCNQTVIWILKHDKNHIFKFSSLNSDFAKQFLSSLNINFDNPDSIILYQNEHYFKEYEAILEILGELFPILKKIKKFLKLNIFMIIGNFFYQIIVKHRKRFFNSKCLIIKGTEYENKFIF
jgi:predicted DCC family thiol-disulfide oxidoreductase YuxK